MEGSLHAAEELNQFIETGIAAGIPATADGDPFQIPAFSLQVCERFIRDCLEILEPAILFPDTAGAVVTSFFERQAVPAPKWLDTPDFLKITIFAESAAINAWASSDVHGQLCHFRYRSLGLKCIRCLHMHLELGYHISRFILAMTLKEFWVVNSKECGDNGG
jgi:hypothetical protein